MTPSQHHLGTISQSRVACTLCSQGIPSWSRGMAVPLLHHFFSQFSPPFAHFGGVLQNMRLCAVFQQVEAPWGQLLGCITCVFVLHNMRISVE
jgi:hypothetical protein